MEVYGVYVSANLSSIWFRACRYYPGVGKLHPKAAIVEDMRWIPICCKLMLDAISLWCHLVFLRHNFVNQFIPEECGLKNCCGIVKGILYECGLESLWPKKNNRLMVCQQRNSNQ